MQISVIRAAKTLLIGLGLATATSGAFAASPTVDAHSIKVSYADLDIRTDSGLQKLYARVVAAAESVCPAPVSGDFNSPVLHRIRECRASAIERAVEKIDNQRLAALHAVRKNKGIS
jgi:UrcA family protein